VTSKPVLKLASDAGLAKLPDVPSLALGTGEVTPLDLTAAYTAFAANGVRAVPRALQSVRDADKSEVYSQPIVRRDVLDPAVSFQMTSMLRDVIDKGTGRATRALGVAGPVAGKTGTTDDYHDAWFVGYSSRMVAGVWVGFDQPKPIGSAAYASQVAVPIWAEFIKRTAAAFPPREFARPSTIEPMALCAVSHQRPGAECPVYTEYFKDGDEVPSDSCPIHRQSLEVRVTRAVDGLLNAIGRRIGGLFRRGKH
jgi:membrane carboxypeptidase/penicillin-binding protein